MIEYVIVAFICGFGCGFGCGLVLLAKNMKDNKSVYIESVNLTKRGG